MAERRTAGEWIKANGMALAMPIVSGIIALGVAYGSYQRNDANTLNRIIVLEAAIIKLEEQDEEYDDEIDDIEDAYEDGDREIKNLLIDEGRDLERKIIRLEGRVDSISRRITFIDGIGAPAIAPALPFETFDEDLELELPE